MNGMDGLGASKAHCIQIITDGDVAGPITYLGNMNLLCCIFVVALVWVVSFWLHRGMLCEVP